jgi:hypothetical protein
MPAAEEHPTDWYVLRGRVRGGPYPYTMVREGVRGDLISKVDLLWRPGWVEWRDAGAIDGLFAATAADRDAAPMQRSGVLAPQPAIGDAAPFIPPPGVQSPAAVRNPDHVPFNYVAAHWRGEFSLPAAFFGNATIVGLILLIAATIFVTVLKENKVTAVQYAVMIAAMSAICLMSIVWLLVGICRSTWRCWSRRDVGGRSEQKPDTPSVTARPPPPPPAHSRTRRPAVSRRVRA